MKKKFFRILMLTAFILVFILSAYQLFQIFLIYHSSSLVYEKVKNAVEDTNNEKSTAFLPDATIDFKQLKTINPDAIAWIIIPDTPINYPVVQTNNNTYYLNHTINKGNDIAGCIFVDYENRSDFVDLHTLLYGHNLKNGMMFAALNHYAKKSFWENNPYFWILTSDKTYCYQIFSTYLVEPEIAKTNSYQIEFQNLEEYQKFLNAITSNSDYKTNITVRLTDKITTLSTCTSQNEFRRVVHGKLINIH